jgi:5'-methylthioadenosine phosphorylase
MRHPARPPPLTSFYSHDLNHRLLPTEIPFRANVILTCGLLLQTVTCCSDLRSEAARCQVSAHLWCLRIPAGWQLLLRLSEQVFAQAYAAPQDVVLVDQFIDRTKARPDTFFGNGVIAHVAMADPVCPKFRQLVRGCLESQNPRPKVHDGGTYVCIEGPAFSTKAESSTTAYSLRCLDLCIRPLSLLELHCDWHDRLAGGQAGSGS